MTTSIDRVSHGPAEAKELLAQVGHAPAMVLGTPNCRETCEELKARGVTILAEPQERPYGVEAVFADLYDTVDEIRRNLRLLADRMRQRPTTSKKLLGECCGIGIWEPPTLFAGGFSKPQKHSR